MLALLGLTPSAIGEPRTSAKLAAAAAADTILITSIFRTVANGPPITRAGFPQASFPQAGFPQDWGTGQFIRALTGLPTGTAGNKSGAVPVRLSGIALSGSGQLPPEVGLALGSKAIRGRYVRSCLSSVG